jgi:SAM-dependent methyltransferase
MIGLHVLHVAPEGPLVHLFRARREIAYVPADLDPLQYRELGGVTFADVASLPWDDDSFDLILCNHVLEHVPNDRKAMKELYRVMRPGGTGIVQVPYAQNLANTIEDPFINNPTEQEHRFGQRDHVRIYGSDYILRLEQAGFKVDLFDPMLSWGHEVVHSLLLDPEEKLFIVQKHELPCAWHASAF